MKTLVTLVSLAALVGCATAPCDTLTCMMEENNTPRVVRPMGDWVTVRCVTAEVRVRAIEATSDLCYCVDNKYRRECK